MRSAKGSEVDGPENGFDEALRFVVDIFARATGLERNQLDPAREFSEFGVDSFMVQKLNARLKETFTLKSNTLFFEFTTILALTRFLWSDQPERFPSVLTQAVRPASSELDVQTAAPASAPVASARQATVHRVNTELAGRAPRSLRLPVRGVTPESKRRDSGERAGDIAIIGYAGRFPQAGDVDSLWAKLINGESAIETIPPDRWNSDDYFSELPPQSGKTYAKWGGFIADVKTFDPAFFKITPREADLMDPQERKFLETAWHVFDHAGYTRQRRTSKHSDNVGVYVGAFFGHYELWGTTEYLHGASEVPSSSISLIANRVSYFFGLRGPSIALDTMCSSSLTALHLACQGLRDGDCELAIAGGVNLILHPQKYLYLCQSRFLAKDGLCRTFGANGSGYVPGEGVGALLLKPLAAAVRDGDTIHAVVLGSAVNHAGKGNGFTVPNVPAQEAVIRSALTRADTDANQVDYVEAHGTGTELGDPIEVDALKKVYGGPRTRRPVPIGSVKSNLGHLESAAGVTGVIKVLLQMKHQTLVPSLHSEPRNPLLDLENSPFCVQTEVAHWSKVGDGDPSVRVAGVSSFGAGGTNAHVLLRSYPPNGLRSQQRICLPALLFSAHSPASLRANVGKVSLHIQKELKGRIDGSARTAYLNDLAYTLAARRETFAFRHAIVFSDAADLLNQLASRTHELEISNSKAQPTTGPGPLDHARQLGELLRERRWGAAMQAWRDGAACDWEQALDFRDCAVVPLPDYEFDSVPHWYPRHSALSLGTEQPASALPNPIDVVERTGIFRVTNVQVTGDERQLQEVLAGSILLTTAGGEPRVVDWRRSAWRTFRVRTELEALSFEPWEGGARLSVEEFVKLCKQRGRPRIVDLVGPLDEYSELLKRSEFWIEMLREFRETGLDVVQWVSGAVVNFAPVSASLLHGLSFEYPQLRTQILETQSALGIEALPESLPVSSGYFVSQAGRWHSKSLSSVESAETLPCRSLDSDKVFVVAGGTRGLGLEAAKVLQSMGARRLVLTGIRPLPPPEAWVPIMMDPSHPQYRTIFALNHLKEKLSSFDIHVGSLGDGREVTAFFDRVGVRRGTLGGVIYSAGIVDDKSLAFVSKSKDSMHRVFEPKVPSLRTFAGIVARMAPEFFVAFSSVAGTFPRLSPGIADYASANHFINHFVERNASDPDTRYYAVAWPSWSDVGMGAVIKENRMGEFGLERISAAEGGVFLRDVLSLPSGVYAPLKTNARFVPEVLLGLNTKPVARERSRDAGPPASPVRTADAESASNVEARVKRLVSTVLRASVSTMDSAARFADMGVESVLMTEIQQSIERELAIELGPAALVQYPTIAALSQYVLSLLPRERASENARPLLDARLEGGGKRSGEQPIHSTGPEARPERCRVAIVGAALRLPGATDLQQFWRNLRSGASAISDEATRGWVRSLRLVGGGVRMGALTSSRQVRTEQVERARTSQSDPNAELFLELTSAALSDAHYGKASLSGRKVGVYAGARSDYSANHIARYEKSLVSAVGQNFVAARASFAHNLKGPSLVVDSACSSGLVATHLACQSLATGEIEMAVAGAVSLLLDERAYQLLSAEGVLSRRGECCAFDESADGFVLGEGGAVLVLKRLVDANRDGDRIYAVIEASGVNNNGRSLGITTPDVDANAELITEVLGRIRDFPMDVRYVEANGTGVPASDMVELRALERAYGQASVRAAIQLGSLKPNIGHLLNASGMASLVKAMLTVNQRQFCPMINLNSPSKHFAFDSSPLRLTRSLTTLAEDARFLVGVNSLGDGGTNAHLLLSNDFAPKLALSEVLQRALLEPSPSSSQAPSNREPEYVYESIWQ